MYNLSADRLTSQSKISEIPSNTHDDRSSGQVVEGDRYPSSNTGEDMDIPKLPDVLKNDRALDALLVEQRARLRQMSETRTRKPQVGDIWTSWAWSWRHRRETIALATESDFAATFVVLRTFVDEWTQHPLIDIAP